MTKKNSTVLEELLLNSKMSKYELVLLAFQYAKVLKNKKVKELKNNYFVTKEVLSDILLKKISREEILKKLKDKEGKSSNENSPKIESSKSSSLRNN